MAMTTDHYSYAKCDMDSGNIRTGICKMEGPGSWDGQAMAIELALKAGWTQDARKWACPIHSAPPVDQSRPRPTRKPKVEIVLDEAPNQPHEEHQQ